MGEYESDSVLWSDNEITHVWTRCRTILPIFMCFQLIMPYQHTTHIHQDNLNKWENRIYTNILAVFSSVCRKACSISVFQSNFGEQNPSSTMYCTHLYIFVLSFVIWACEKQKWNEKKYESVKHRNEFQRKWNACAQCDNQKYIILYMSHFAIDWMFKCDYFPSHFVVFMYDLVRAVMHMSGFLRCVCMHGTTLISYFVCIFSVFYFIQFGFVLPRLGVS